MLFAASSSVLGVFGIHDSSSSSVRSRAAAAVRSFSSVGSLVQRAPCGQGLGRSFVAEGGFGRSFGAEGGFGRSFDAEGGYGRSFVYHDFTPVQDDLELDINFHTSACTSCSPACRLPGAEFRDFRYLPYCCALH